MKKLGYRIITVCLALGLILPVRPASADRETAVSDVQYTYALDTLVGLGLMQAEDTHPTSNITRAKFADMLAGIIGYGDNESETENKTKYLGYTNDPEFDSNGDWVWKDGESADAANDELEHATPFRDVLTTHRYWNSIRLAARFGLMTGSSDGYFRPNDEIKICEALKVLVYACGSGEKVAANYPAGVIREAGRLKIINDFANRDVNGYMTQRDAVVMIANALDANVYDAVSYSDRGIEYKVSRDETLLSYYKGIYKLEGTVTKNRFTSLTGTEGTGKNAVCVDDIYLVSGDKNFDSFLGYNVDAYYTKAKIGSDLTAVYMRNSGRGNEIVVNAEDIIGYSANKLSYQKDGESKKERYIGAKSNIIYNGKALTDYTAYSDSLFVPKQGSVRFADGDGDGTYETVFIDNIETIIVDSIDFTNEIIYSKLDEPKSLDISDGDVFITDSDSMTYVLGDITSGSVLDVLRTLPTQGDSLINIKRAFSAVTGVVEKHSPSKRQITVGSKVYEYSKDFDTSLIESGKTITFYINTTGKIIWANRGSELEYAFLADIDFGKFAQCEKIWLYDLGDEELTAFEPADRIRVNRVITRPENLNQTAVYDSSAGKTDSQLIKYKLNSNGKICEILTANVDENEFVEQDIGTYKGQSLLYRNAAKALVSKVPVLYMSENSVYATVPKTDFKNENLYGRLDMKDNSYFIVDRVYKNSSKSAVASIILQESDVVANAEKKKEITDDSTPLSMVMEVENSVTDDGESSVIISGMNGENGYFSNTAVDSDIISMASELNPGDLIRYEVHGKNNYITRLIKVFDVKDRVWFKAQNPYSTNVNAFNTRMHALHGEIEQKYDDGMYAVVAPYIYSSDGSGGVFKDGLESNAALFYTYNVSAFKVYCFDSENEELTVSDAKTELISAQQAGKGSEVVVYTNNSNPRAIFVFK